MVTPTKEEIQEYMEAHNNDEVGQGEGNAWSFEDAEYHLLLSDKYHYQKTLAQLKKDIIPGVSILLINFEEVPHEKGPDAPLEWMETPPKLKKQGIVSLVNTTGFYVKRITDTNQAGKGSFCNWPRATDLFYTDNTFTIGEKDTNGKIWQRRTYQLTK